MTQKVVKSDSRHEPTFIAGSKKVLDKSRIIPDLSMKGMYIINKE